MDPTVTHDEVRELLGVFALDAVDPGEAAAIRAHLGDCPRCRDEVADYQQTAARLANTGGAAPAEVWDAIVVRIEQPATAVGEFPGLPRRGRRPPAPGRRIRPGVVRRAAVLTAAAAIAVIAVLGVEVGHLNHRLNQVAAASAGHNMSAQALSALLDPAARRMTLVSAATGGAPAATVVAGRSGAAFLFNEQLPALPAAETYQLWAMIDGQPISVGLLGSHPDTVAFSLDTASATNAFAITIEPAGGSVAPTRPPVASTTI